MAKTSLGRYPSLNLSHGKSLFQFINPIDNLYLYHTLAGHCRSLAIRLGRRFSVLGLLVPLWRFCWPALSVEIDARQHSVPQPARYQRYIVPGL